MGVRPRTQGLILVRADISQHCRQEVLHQRPFELTYGFPIGQRRVGQVHATKVSRTLVNDHDVLVNVAILL